MLKQLLLSLGWDGNGLDEGAEYFSGTGAIGEQSVTLIATAHRAAVGIDLLFAQAEVVLQTIKESPTQPIIFLIDTQGQKLNHYDELLGLNRYMAHLGKCIELARQMGHPTVGIVYGEAVSGGFITSGLMADHCMALDVATIKVMALPAMARIMRVPSERLVELAETNPVFAPGAENYFKMGAVAILCQEKDLVNTIQQILASARKTEDERLILGKERGGRLLAHRIVEAILEEPGIASTST